MAGLNPEQRSDVQHYARQLIRAGVSRRKMDAILKEYSLEKYGIGQSIGKATHSRLFQARVSTIQRQGRRYQAKERYTTPRKRKESNYNKLISAHLLPQEARLLTDRLTTLRTNEIRGMLQERRQLYSRFLKRAAEQGYSKAEIPARWEQFVLNWYARAVTRWQRAWERAMIKRGASLSKRIRDGNIGYNDLLWKWYGHTKEQLPPEMQADTPRKHQRKKQKPPTVDVFRRSKKNRREETIANLQALLDKETSPMQRAWYRELIEKEKHKK